MPMGFPWLPVHFSLVCKVWDQPWKQAGFRLVQLRRGRHEAFRTRATDGHL